MAEQWPECCYETDEMGQITRFRCSKYGWAGYGETPCRCSHHEGEVSLAGRLLHANGVRMAGAA